MYYSSSAEKDLEVLEDSKLIVSQLYALAAMTANSSRNRTRRLSKITIPLYSALVRPQQDIASSFGTAVQKGW